MNAVAHNPGEVKMYPMYEALARERMRADQAYAAQRRLGQRMESQRRWRAVVRYAQRRVDRLDG